MGYNCENNGVYILSNIETGDFYIGSTIDVCRRIKDHFRDLDSNKHVNWKLQRSYNKNPNFLCHFIHFKTRQLALEFEDLMIKKFKNHVHLLNICLDVEQPRLGILASDETKQKQSISARKFYLNGGKNSMDGKKHTSDSLLKISKAAKKQFESSEIRNKFRELAVARFQNLDYRERHRSSVISTMNNRQLRHQLSESAKNRWSNSEERLKQSKMAIDRFQDPDQRKVCSDAGKAAWSNLDFRLRKCRKVKINGTLYESIMDASRVLNISEATVRYRIDSLSEQFQDWNYFSE